MSARAIIFDLDDTLYRERRFALGGFLAVADAIERRFRVRRERTFPLLVLALRQGRRSQAFQDLCQRFDLPAVYIPTWVDIFRGHQPGIRLSHATRAMLEALRPAWRVGILTNGLPSVQASKVRALGIDLLVDAVVYAEQFGGGKPDPLPFFEVLSRLDGDPWRSVFVGDSESRDMDGARRVGMHTVLVRHGRSAERGSTPGAEAVVRSLAEVPSVAERLLSEEPAHVS